MVAFYGGVPAPGAPMVPTPLSNMSDLGFLAGGGDWLFSQVSIENLYVAIVLSEGGGGCLSNPSTLPFIRPCNIITDESTKVQTLMDQCSCHKRYPLMCHQLDVGLIAQHYILIYSTVAK